VRLKDVWADGPRTYLGQLAEGFPNLLMVLGYNGNGVQYRRKTAEVAAGGYQEFAFR
jgi:cation diffusion facilitator CzcD-associated flavoprotein CzcO